MKFATSYEKTGKSWNLTKINQAVKVTMAENLSTTEYPLMVPVV